MTIQPTPDPQEITAAIKQVDGLGTASERLFSRLYRTFLRRSRVSWDELAAQNRAYQRQLEQREAEIERLNAILATIDEGVIMQDNDGRLVMFNNAARELLGSVKSFWQSELGTLFNNYRDIATVDSEISPLSEPTRVQVNNRIIGAQLAAVADEAGRRLGTIIVLRDVTRETLSERLKDQFVTAISHELRTPMAVIKGVSEVMQNLGENQPPNRKLLETLSRNVDILDRMIVELLDISELTTDEFTVRRNRVRVEELIWNTINGLMPEIRRAQLDVALMAGRAKRLYISGDAEKLRWAFGHLLQNSIRYTEPGGHVLITASRTDPTQITLQVSDTGVGISERDLPHIFERFYRGEPRTASGKVLDPRGLGQGLFIARRVTEAHGGYLSVRSQQGQGSVFTMVLPAAS